MLYILKYPNGYTLKASYDHRQGIAEITVYGSDGYYIAHKSQTLSVCFDDFIDRIDKDVDKGAVLSKV